MCHPWGVPWDAYITRVHPWPDKIKERSDVTVTRNRIGLLYILLLWLTHDHDHDHALGMITAWSWSWMWVIMHDHAWSCNFVQFSPSYASLRIRCISFSRLLLISHNRSTTIVNMIKEVVDINCRYHLKSAVQLAVETLRDHDKLLPRLQIWQGKEGWLGASTAENRRDHGQVPYLVWIDRSIHGS